MFHAHPKASNGDKAKVALEQQQQQQSSTPGKVGGAPISDPASDEFAEFEEAGAPAMTVDLSSHADPASYATNLASKPQFGGGQPRVHVQFCTS